MTGMCMNMMPDEILGSFVFFLASNAARMDKSCHTRECLDKCAVWQDLEVLFVVSHAAHMDESCHTRE